MVNTYPGLILPLIASASATFLFRQFFLTVPDELCEAARIDGASPMQFFWTMLLPLSRSNIAALAIILFLYGWNQYLWPLLFTTDKDMATAVDRPEAPDPARRFGAGLERRDGAALLTMLPPVIVVIAAAALVRQGAGRQQQVSRLRRNATEIAMVMIVGHRGARNLWPENSLERFSQAARARRRRGRVRRARDARRQLVVIHDPMLDRTTEGRRRRSRDARRGARCSASPAARRCRASEPADRRMRARRLDAVLALFAATPTRTPRRDQDQCARRARAGRGRAAGRRRARAARRSSAAILTCFVPEVLEQVRAARGREARVLASLDHALGRDAGWHRPRAGSATRRCRAASWRCRRSCSPRAGRAASPSLGTRAARRAGCSTSPTSSTAGCAMPMRQITTDRPDLALGARRRSRTAMCGPRRITRRRRSIAVEALLLAQRRCRGACCAPAGAQLRASATLFRPTRSRSASHPAARRPAASCCGRVWRPIRLQATAACDRWRPVEVNWRGRQRRRLQRNVVAAGRAGRTADRRTPSTSKCAALRPGRDYWYRFDAGGAREPGRPHPHRARGRRQRRDRLRFAFASCQQYEQGYFAAYRDMARAAARPRRAPGRLHLRKLVGRAPRPPSHGAASRRRSPNFATATRCTRADPDLQAAHAAFPWLVTWDDHEVANDYTNDVSPRTRDPAQFLAMRAAAYQAWYEHMPVPAQHAARAGPTRGSTRITASATCSTSSLLDGRQYRSRHACLPGRRASPLVDCAAPGSIRHAACSAPQQEAWLAQRCAARPHAGASSRNRR